MNANYLTPHQFSSIEANFDTLLVTGYTPFALDIAVPFAASQWITCTLADGIQKQFAGRVSQLDTGAGLVTLTISDALAAIASQWMHRVRFGVVLAERRCLHDVRAMVDPSGRPWVVFDWWQWLRTRVPEARLAEAWLYMCYACPAYFDSPEHQLAGTTPAAAQSMAQEGRRLLDEVEGAIAQALVTMWENTQEETQESRGQRG